MRNKQKGSALYFAIIIMGVLFTLGMSATTMFISQLKMIESIGLSITAFYAADTGTEEILYYWGRFDELEWEEEHELTEGVYYMYKEEERESGEWWDESNITSIGSHRGVRRAIMMVRRTSPPDE